MRKLRLVCSLLLGFLVVGSFVEVPLYRSGWEVRAAAGGVAAVNWTVSPAITGEDLNSIRKAGSRYIVVGNNGIILTSADGVSWDRQVSPTAENLRSLAWNGTLLVVVGDNGTVLTSSDAVNWVESAGDFGMADLMDVAWVMGKFVAVGERILVSADGFQWNTYNPGAKFDAVAANGTTIVAVGGNHRLDWIVYSSDGVTWQRALGHHENSDRFHSVIWTGNRFLAVGGGYDQCKFYSSADGIHWVDEMTSVWAGDGEIFNVTFDGSSSWSWSASPGNHMFAFSKVTIANGELVALGGPLSWIDGPYSFALLTTEDNLTWSSYFWDNTEFISREEWQNAGYPDSRFIELRDIMADGSQYLVVGKNGFLASSMPEVPTLTVTNDGISLTLSWTSVPGAEGYTLYFAPYPDASFIGNADMGGLTGISGDLWPGAAFYMAVQAYNGTGAGGISNIEYFVLP